EVFGAEGFQVEALAHSLPPEELAAKIADVHILGIRSKTHVPAAALAAGRRLLTVGCFCIGTNQVDLDAANRRGIPLFNAPVSHTRSVAEMIVAEIVALARQLGDRSREVHEGRWRKVAARGSEIPGKGLGIGG